MNFTLTKEPTTDRAMCYSRQNASDEEPTRWISYLYSLVSDSMRIDEKFFNGDQAMCIRRCRAPPRKNLKTLFAILCRPLGHYGDSIQDLLVFIRRFQPAKLESVTFA